MKKSLLFLWIIFITLLPASLLWSQETTDTTEPAIEEEVVIPEVKLTPRFPEENTKLIFVEGESAVSTNFNKQPILNYGCSGQRSLQLNRMKGLQGGAAFYADFVFFIEEPGTYELWYGGTPSGPADEMHPSYVSPFKYIIDNAEEPYYAYREDIAVVENYTPSYYWNQVSEVELEQGKHQIRFEVDEKRRYDGRYYFYLDCFFLIKIEDGERITGDILPDLFPKDMDDRRINFPFRSIDDYLIILRDNAEKVEPYVELSLIYSLVSDYLNAIKYLKRATLLDAENLDYQLLLAKNYIWKGEIEKGLELYKNLLTKDPKRKDIWMEAAKIAAWTSRYDESIDFFRKALDFFPSDLDFLVNLGLTHLWTGANTDAGNNFISANNQAGGDVELIKDLAKVFEVNGYPTRAADVYSNGINKSPESIELYTLLEEIYFNNGMKDKANKVKERIDLTFLPSPRLDKYVDLFREKMSLKEQVIEEYIRRLEEEPDNLSLREMLAQAYFWNGLKKESISEYFNILSNHAYRYLKDMEQENFPLLKIIDKCYIYNDYIQTANIRFNEKRKILAIAVNSYSKAKKELEAYTLRKQKAEEAGKTFTEPAINPADTVREYEETIASLVADTELMIDRYNTIIEEFQSELIDVDRMNEENDKDKEVFEKITGMINWKWNRNFMIRELEQVASGGLVLANHILAKISQISQKYPEAILKYNTVSAEITYPDLEYGYFQTLLWNKQIPQAIEYFNRPESQIMDYAFYTEEIKDLILSYQDEIVDTFGVATEDTGDEGFTALQTLGEKVLDIAEQQKALNDAFKVLHLVLEETMIRTFYDYEESTYLLRNELGDSLIVAERLDEAIAQYNMVLAIDPWDISAIYRVGTVYQWNNQWKRAMNNFKNVYYSDPNYESANYLYNYLAREHADHLGFLAEYDVDNASITWRGHGFFSSELSEFFGIGVDYRMYNKQNYKIWLPPTYHDANYQVHDLSLSFPISMFRSYFKITPQVGAVYTLDPSVTASFGIPDPDDGHFILNDPLESTIIPSASYFFSKGKILPYTAADYAIGKYPELVTSGQVRYGIYDQTLAIGTDKVNMRALTGTANIATDLTFTNLPFIKNFALRGYGALDYIEDTYLQKLTDANRADVNIIWTASGEMTFNLYRSTEPWANINLFGNVLYQDCTISDDTDLNTGLSYYSPHETLAAGGGFTATTNLGLSESYALGLNLSLSGSYNQSLNAFDNSPDKTFDKSVKLQGSGGFELSKGNATISLGGIFSYNLNLATNTWDAWNFGASLGYTSSLPDLLAP